MERGSSSSLPSQANLMKRCTVIIYGGTAEEENPSLVVEDPDNATGFFLTNDGIIVSIAHFMKPEKPNQKYVVWQEGQPLGWATYLTSDLQTDLFLLKLDIPSNFLPLGDARRLEDLAPLAIVGYPNINGIFSMITQGFLGCKIYPVNWKNQTVIRYRADVASNPGNSGSPIFSGNYIVGIQTGLADGFCGVTKIYQQGGAIFIPANEIQQFIKSKLAEIRSIEKVAGDEFGVPIALKLSKLIVPSIRISTLMRPQ